MTGRRMWRGVLAVVFVACASLVHVVFAATVDAVVGQAVPAGESGTDSMYGLGVDLDVGDDWMVATRLMRTDGDGVEVNAVQLGIECHFTSGGFSPYLVAGGAAAWLDADEAVTVTQATGKGGHCTGSGGCGRPTVYSVDVDTSDDQYLSLLGGGGLDYEIAAGWGLTGEIVYVAPVNSDVSGGFAITAGLSYQVGK